MSYSPKTSGLMQGGGRTKRYTHRSLRKFKLSDDFPNLMLSAAADIKREIPDYEEGRSYNDREMILLAEKIILQDIEARPDGPCVLTASAYLRRTKREIYSNQGVVDPAYAAGLYFRAHPNGRKLHTKAQRRDGEGFYKSS